MKCFKHLAEIHPTMNEAFYGIALCSFKLERFQDALQYIDHTIAASKQPIKNFKYYKYLKAACLKQLGNYTEAENYYTELCRHSTPSHTKVPLAYLLFNTCYVPKDGWKIDNKQTAIGILENSEFFKRFNSSDLEHIMKLMKVLIHPSNTLLFLDESTVAVILQGKVSIYSHIKDLDNPDVIAEYGPGSIIGNSSTDNGVSRYAEYWVYANTELELCIFLKENFNVMLACTR
eukprot:TRINITY_DN5240_c0_g2_i1.p1 TRINITY_DN5240_c0_g2~~TRINITY_DN5240_c0_g2_i1.p1  ORF type:complete len:232 (+),score=25.77 TRINITY_DN5240_c0_g2_i1:455-1150(+)